ncbi:hypothetical protein [Streptomyces sp. MK37H]|uniref:hypothetical protein n=1 Tax=Streptomyces sp. MK37H TaxID=2699117 RepID=UPI0035A84521
MLGVSAEEGEAGPATRQVEFQGPELTPIAAACLDERRQAHDGGHLDEYDSRFGITADLPVSGWEGHDPEHLTSGEFEAAWGPARRQIAARPR